MKECWFHLYLFISLAFTQKNEHFKEKEVRSEGKRNMKERKLRKKFREIQE